MDETLTRREMVPPQGSYLVDRVVAVLTLCYSSVFGDASPAQAAGIVVPLLFLIYRWYKIDRPRARIIARHLESPQADDLKALKQSSTGPGDLA
jgi:hypothetical protein